MEYFIILIVAFIMIFGFYYARKDKREKYQIYTDALKAGNKAKALEYGRKYYSAKYGHDVTAELLCEDAIANDFKIHNL